MPGGPAASGGGIGGTKKNKLAGVALTAFSAFGGILFGYDTGVINGVKEMKDWLRTFGRPDPSAPSGYSISSANESLVVSILSAGTFFGALLGAPMADYIGRKWGIVFACLVFSVGVAMQTAATAIPLFVRILLRPRGISPKWIRGAIVSMYQWAITIGLLVAAIVNNFTQHRDDHSSYRIPIAIQFIWAAILAGGMLFLPESPRWLVKRGRDNDAAVALSRVTGHKRTDPEVDVELEEIRANLQAELALGESSYIDCFRCTKNRIALRTLTGIFIQAWQQLTGINFIFYYGTTFFKNSGVSDPFLISIATNIVNVFMTLPGMWGVERFGRRRLLLVGAAGMCICEYIIAIVGVTVSVENLAGQKVLIAFVCIYIAFFAATWGPIAWVITGEIFPLQVRAKAMSLSVATPYLVNKQPGSAGLEAKVFFIWGSTCFCCIVFTYFCVPETKGLSLEQIDLMYQNTLPVNSLKYRRRLMSEGTSAADKEAKTEERSEDKA
ncbi:hypothetical protein C0993_012519 [Termitomyces sp. T159_Od127]|nr:hypothetical protein C0993_012519 [Termitomyces sp. T159_Od127]